MVHGVVQLNPVDVWASAPGGSDWICTWLVVPRVIVAQPASMSVRPVTAAAADKIRMDPPPFSTWECRGSAVRREVPSYGGSHMRSAVIKLQLLDEAHPTERPSDAGLSSSPEQAFVRPARTIWCEPSADARVDHAGLAQG